MPTTNPVAVSGLSLDLNNFRTVPQPDEDSAIKAMIAIKPDYFWALLESMLESGYLPTENVIVLREVGPPKKFIVKEGNRRVAVLKIALGQKNAAHFGVPAELVTRISNLPVAWISDNSQVPCTVYDAADSITVDRIVTLIHGKSEKAGRDKWQPVARARHNRNVQGASEPALDVLEKYLQSGRNVTAIQRERWAGEYPITVLEEAIKKLAKRVGASSSTDFASRYPATISCRDELEEIFNNIGLSILRFEHLRNTADFALPYGIPTTAVGSGTGSSGTGSTGAGGTGTNPGTGGTSTGAGSSTDSSGTSGTRTGGTGTNPGTGSSGTGAGSGTGSSGTGGTGAGSSTPAFNTRDPKAVIQTLKQLTPSGVNRQKVVALRDEAMKLKIEQTPLAFCFVLRSLFEISAKAYCQDRPTVASLSLLKSDGNEKSLVDLLRAITQNLTTDAAGKRIKPMEKKLHGAMTEIAKTDGLLSVTSMNQLVHNPSFSLTIPDICTTFGNIYPLLEAMN